ncbi:MAG: T9SS type A sorting domain-containing protein [Crocinitomicaceae bacterium]
MKQLILYIIIFIIMPFMATAQCYPDRHSTAWYEGWISCEKSENPNTTRPESHWIMYDFGTIMEMYNLSIWNINAPEYLDYGIQTAEIDYSEDGINWFEYGEVTLSQGTGKNNYEGLQLLNFDGKNAKYLLITSTASFGSECAGFAELKLEVDSVEITEPSDTTIVDPILKDSICIIADVYPNPIADDNVLNIHLIEQCVPSVHYRLIDENGRVVVPSTPISLDETVEILKGIELAAGVYIVELTSNYAKSEYKVIKQ